MSQYQPHFTFTNAIVASVARISERLGVWTARRATTLSPQLRRGHRIQTIQASLAIEHNTLSVEQALNIALQENNAADEEVNDGVSDDASDRVNIKLDRLDQQLLDAMREDPCVTQEGLVALRGKSLRTIQRRMRKLRQHHIERIGSDKSGYWQVKQFTWISSEKGSHEPQIDTDRHG